LDEDVVPALDQIFTTHWQEDGGKGMLIENIHGPIFLRKRIDD
jgi:hypothetical protein